jgi:hypothetical protein
MAPAKFTFAIVRLCALIGPSAQEACISTECLKDSPKPMTCSEDAPTLPEQAALTVGIFMNDNKYGKLHKALFGEAFDDATDDGGEKAPEDQDGPMMISWRRIASVQEAMSCDLLVHKVFDLEISLSSHDLGALEAMAPERILDPLPWVRLLSDRQLTVRSLQHFFALHPELPFSVPETIFLEDICHAPDTIYPAILKPVSACSDPHSHTLHLLKSPGQLLTTLMHKIDTNNPYILQRFVPHGGHLLKVYVIGEAEDIVLKGSLTGEHFCDDHPVQFDSQSLKNVTMPPSSLVLDVNLLQHLHALARLLRDHLRLRLFGIDVIVPQHSSPCLYGSPSSPLLYHVVDVNYFPGYSGVQDMGPKLIKLLWQRSRPSRLNKSGLS